MTWAEVGSFLLATTSLINSANLTTSTSTWSLLTTSVLSLLSPPPALFYHYESDSQQRPPSSPLGIKRHIIFQDENSKNIWDLRLHGWDGQMRRVEPLGQAKSWKEQTWLCNEDEMKYNFRPLDLLGVLVADPSLVDQHPDATGWVSLGEPGQVLPVLGVRLETHLGQKSKSI